SVFASEPTGILRPVSTIGWDESSALLDHPWLSLTQLPLLFANAHLQHGCALLEADAVRALLDLKVPLPVGRKNGDGPLAWKDHLLLVALADPEGRPVGVLWADEPSDRLLPGPEALAALRVFAGQAAAALALSRRQPQQLGADELTGLPTRETLADRLGHALRRNQRTETGVAVLFLDVDRFAQINQRLGHVAGDELLERIAARLDDAERLRVALAPPIPTSAGHVPVTVSIGVALAAPHSAEADALLQAADRAMYEAKAAGRDAARLASRDAEWDA
ncbi:MAG TPA: GGDEF domain-containing protein, partial [Baekduia sp.]|nr:GGDEF domain-containing protein [Baekduia sp.]